MMEPTVSHMHLKEVISQTIDLDYDPPQELIDRLGAELRHSNLIVAADVASDGIEVRTADFMDMTFIVLFTDMDEFAKAFPDFSVSALNHPFHIYLDMLESPEADGFIINIEGECLFLPEGCFTEEDYFPVPEYSFEGSYFSEELAEVKKSIDNASLVKFVENPKNVGMYEELFDEISNSTMLMLRLSDEDLRDWAEDGMISMESEPVGFLHSDRAGGKYASVFTSERKMESVHTTLNRYSQMANFSQMADCALSGDMDGIVINPESDNIILTREILLEFSPVFESTCNDSRLNSAIFHMFLMEG